MYNDRRYSLARYSANQETKTVEVAESFSEAMGAVAGAAIPVDFRDRYSETLQGSAQGTVSVVSVFSAAERLLATARMSADVVTRAVLSEVLRGSIYGQKNTPAALAVWDALDARTRGSKNVPAPLELADRLTAAAAGSKNVPALLKASEVMTSMLEATSQTTERTTLQLTILPGGELRIDSELFLVLLNGENALHTQSGDWINVSRDLLRLIIESASGGQLRGQLIYTERYL